MSTLHSRLSAGLNGHTVVMSIIVPENLPYPTSPLRRKRMSKENCRFDYR
ncbi:hypothetical protein KCP76_06495 [Salmonella enterica subsp. enterica serovar Weltevreden]|nr:hypothetical protein KCP76_06495 [Salmonella enterica subsp. enterica serovar Weltevreden]